MILMRRAKEGYQPSFNAFSESFSARKSPSNIDPHIHQIVLHLASRQSPLWNMPAASARGPARRPSPRQAAAMPKR